MSLREVYEPYFKMGVAVPDFAIGIQDIRNNILKQFNSMTCENEMKPERVLDMKENIRNPREHEFEPAFDFTSADVILSFAYNNGISMRGHTLVWHNQTPEAFFHEDYDCNKPYMSRDNMLKRLEGYIKGVISYVDTKYPGLVYAWDVVNEAIEEEGFRPSNWTKVVGNDFIIEAFRIARKYVSSDTKLFYNDYDTFRPWKRDYIVELILKPLLEEKLIDGMGMQTHLTMYEPRLNEYQEALEIYGSLVNEVHVTELDIHNADGSVEAAKKLAIRYKKLFIIYLDAIKNGKANITSVTFWGAHDGLTWLTGFRREKSYPLLFDDCFNPKECYWSTVSVPGIVEGDVCDRLPHGQKFDFWEQDVLVKRKLYVDCNAANASDDNDGSENKPFKTISAAADVATPGTKVVIRGGEYRECVSPKVSGNGPDSMIVYEAAEGEKVVIKASEIVDKFNKSTQWSFRQLSKPIDTSNVNVWEAEIDPDKFRGYNPFCAINLIHDRLYIEYGKTDMLTYLNRRGMVFCDGKPLQQVPLFCNLAEVEGSYWVEANGMKVHIRLVGDEDPHEHLIEFTCREQCFAPKEPFVSYIKVKGITCAHAATGAPVPQRGAISAYRGHHWVIEDCEIDWSNCVGIDIGDECWHHDGTREIIGHSVIRRCVIKDCGVCGIAGLLSKKMLVEDNLITGTGWQKMELSWEAGGIKLHCTVDSLIRRNIFKDTIRADHLWFDIANENNRITSNLFLDGRCQREAIFIECSRDDVNLIDNNIFWNIEGRFEESDIPVEPGSTGWYKNQEIEGANGYAIYGEGTDHLQIVNNFIGNVRSAGYFQRPTSFRFGEFGMRGGTSIDASIVNNIFYDCKEAAIKFPTKDNYSEGNVFTGMYNGGYLRVLNPAPQTNLDLKAWQQINGFDKMGLEGRFNASVDTDKLTITFTNDESTPFVSQWGEKKHTMVSEVSMIHPVMGYKGINSDFYGNICEMPRIPGPFSCIENGIAIDIDPRKLK